MLGELLSSRAQLFCTKNHKSAMAGGDDSVPPCAVNSRLWHPGAKSSRFRSRSQRAAEAKDQVATRAATTKSSPIALAVCCRSLFGMLKRARDATGDQDALGIPGPEGLAAATADPRAIRNHRREGAVSNALPRRSARHCCLPHIQRRRRGREAVRQDGNPAMDDRPKGRPAARLRLSQEDDPRMPAILEDDAWSTWLGEGDATPAAIKNVLKTMEGVNWQAAPEPKKLRSSRKP
jgi:hypothetical protein